MFSKRDHMLEYKTSLNKFKKNEIISSIFFDLNDYRMNRLAMKSRKKSKGTLKQMNMRTHQLKICGTQQKQYYEGYS